MYSRMPFGTPNQVPGLILLKVPRTECDPLVDCHSLPDHRCLSDHDPGPVINKEALSDPGSRVDIDAGLRVSYLGDDTWHIWNFGQVQLVRNPMQCNGSQTWVDQRNQMVISFWKRRVIAIRCFRISVECLPDLRQRIEESYNDPIGRRSISSRGRSAGLMKRISEGQCPTDETGQPVLNSRNLTAHKRVESRVSRGRSSVTGEQEGEHSFDHPLHFGGLRRTNSSWCLNVLTRLVLVSCQQSADDRLCASRWGSHYRG